MHICILSDKFPPHAERGGSSLIASTLAEQYFEEGHKISVISTCRNRQDAGIINHNGLDVHFIYMNYGYTSLKKRLRAYVSIFNPKTLPKVANYLDRIQPDVIHAHNIHGYLSYHSLKLACDRNIPVLLTFHDSMSFAYGPLTHFTHKVDESRLPHIPKEKYQMSTLELINHARTAYFPLRNFFNKKYINRCVDIGIAVSDELKKALNANNIQCDDFIHNGVDVNNFKSGDGAKFRKDYSLGGNLIILFGGRVSRWKGAAKLARAFGNIAQQFPKARVVVVGDPNGYVDRMKDFADPHGDKIVKTGWLDFDEMVDAYHAADIVTTPSICLDSFPTMNLEAMATSTPVIASCFGGAKELVIDGKTGTITNPLDIDSFSDDIADLLEDEVKRKRYGKRGFERVAKNFSLKIQIRKYIKKLEYLSG